MISMKKNVSNDDLAVMINAGFKEQSENMINLEVKVDAGFSRLDHRLNSLTADYTPLSAHRKLAKRVTTLEKTKN